jgi:hypothetical protein
LKFQRKKFSSGAVPQLRQCIFLLHFILFVTY